MIGKMNSTVIAVLFNDDGNDDEDHVITSDVALREVNVNTAYILIKRIDNLINN